MAGERESPLQSEAGPRFFGGGWWCRAPNPSLPSLQPRAGRSGHLSDEEPANFLVIPAEGGETLMVSCGETTFIAGAAAWVGG